MNSPTQMTGLAFRKNSSTPQKGKRSVGSVTVLFPHFHEGEPCPYVILSYRPSESFLISVSLSYRILEIVSLITIFSNQATHKILLSYQNQADGTAVTRDWGQGGVIFLASTV